MYIDSMYADSAGSVIERKGKKKKIALSFLTASSILYVTTFYYVTFGFILFHSLFLSCSGSFDCDGVF